MAYGTHTVCADNGDSVTLPSSIRHGSMIECYKGYQACCEEANRLKLSYKKFRFLQHSLSPEIETSRTAVDSVYVKCWLRNFDDIKKLLPEITLGRPHVSSNLSKLLPALEDYVKNVMPRNLSERNDCKMLSYTWLQWFHFRCVGLDESSLDDNFEYVCSKCKIAK